MISILLKTEFGQTSIHSQSLVKILWRSEKDKITFKAIDNRYGLRETVSKHPNTQRLMEKILLFETLVFLKFFFRRILSTLSLAPMDPILSMLLILLGYVWAACVGTNSPANASGMPERCVCTLVTNTL